MDFEHLARQFETADWSREFPSKLAAIRPATLSHPDLVLISDRVRRSIEKGRAGHALNWLSLGLYLDEAGLVAHVRRSGLLRASKYRYQGKVLCNLVLGVLKRHETLQLSTESHRYFDSVSSLLTLSGEALRIYQNMVRELTKRKNVVIKSLVVVVDILFLKPRLANRQSVGDDPAFYAIEDYAESLSFLIYTFSSVIGIKDHHFNFLDEEGISQGIYDRLLISGCKLKAYHEAELLLDVFSYAATTKGRVVRFLPIDVRLEQSIRLGYIQTTFQSIVTQDEKPVEDGDAPLSMKEIIERTYRMFGDTLVRRIDKPLSRYALIFPDVPTFFAFIRDDGLSKEEVAYVRLVSREQYTHPSKLLTFKLDNQLSVLDIVKIQRLLGFLGGLMTQFLLPLLKNETDIAIRSLVPVFRKDKIRELLQRSVNDGAVEAFLRIATYDQSAASGQFDVQYQPLIAGRDYYILPLNVLCSSNLLRNLFYTQKKKVQDKENEAPMQRLLTHFLRHRYSCVAENVKIKAGEESLEIDIIAVVGSQLLLIECKSSFHPCGVHELRTSYDHILRAADQLDRLREVLQREDMRRLLLNKLGWAVSVSEDVLTCIVTSNRMFNGYEIRGHPVRQAYEMIGVISEGTIRMNDETYRVWEKASFQDKDLLNYVAGSTTHADFFAAMEDALLRYPMGSRELLVSTFALNPERLQQAVRARYSCLTGEPEGKDH